MIYQRLIPTTLCAVALLSSAAAGPSGRARAEDAPAQGSVGVLDGLLEKMGVKTTVGPTPDFVQATHPDPSTLKFLATGTPHPKRSIPVKSAADIAAAKAALDTAQAAQLQPKPTAPPTPLKSARKAKAKPSQAAAGN